MRCPQVTSPHSSAAARKAAVARAVLRHLLLVPRVDVRGNVGRQSPLMQHRPGLRVAQDAPPAVRLARLPQTRVVAASPIDVGTPIGGRPTVVSSRLIAKLA